MPVSEKLDVPSMNRLDSTSCKGSKGWRQNKEWHQRLVQASQKASPQELAVSRYLWRDLWARPSQLPPVGTWRAWLLLAGRGFGKTRSGAEYIRAGVEEGCRRLALVGRTSADVRDTMVEGESGLLAVCPPWMGAQYQPSRRRVIFRGLGHVTAFLYSADEPDLLRGPQHDRAWADEISSWQYKEAFDNLDFGLRLGADPRMVATTTPRRTPLMKDLLTQQDCRITGGSTYENVAHLPASFIRRIVTRYEGTSLGRQELHAQVLDDVEGALWTQAVLDRCRVPRLPCDLARVVVAIDPSATSDAETSNEAGIIVGGLGTDGHGYILQDVSGVMSPLEWAKKGVTAYHGWKADRLVAETNNGGDMVEATVRVADPNVAYKKVIASRGKHTRAEPVAALFERGMVHMVGCFAQLEDQLTTWLPGDESPDRLDAMVWVITELMLDKTGAPKIREL